MSSLFLKMLKIANTKEIWKLLNVHAQDNFNRERDQETVKLTTSA